MKNILMFKEQIQEVMAESIKDCHPDELFSALVILMVKKGVITIPEINDAIDELRAEACRCLAENMRTYEV